MTSSDYEQIRESFRAAGQDHVFTFWDSLSESEKKSLLTQLEEINPQHVTQIAQEVLLPKLENQGCESPAVIEPLPAQATESILNASPAKIQSWHNRGMELIAANKVAVILLAGGQGTRLGSPLPKGCYDVGLPSHKTLFQLQAERIIKLCELAENHKLQRNNQTNGQVNGHSNAHSNGHSNGNGHVNGHSHSTVIPWYIMTSGPTRQASEEFFKSHNYFGLDPKNVTFFEQGILPCLTKEGKIIMENPYTVAVAPDGNGGIYTALNRHGILKDIAQRGIEHLHTYCVDNSLVKVADPVFIGFSALRGVDIATKVVRKRDAKESVGLIVCKNGAPGVIEYSEISAELASATVDGDSSLLKFRAANIVNHYYSAKFLLSIPNWETSYLPFHVAHKKIPFVDLKTGVVTKPTAPNGVKLEQFVFDVFPRLDFTKFASLEVSRVEEFSPLKNGPGAGVDDPSTSRRDLLEQSSRWLTAVGAILDGVVEVSPLTSYGGEGLEKYKAKRLESEFIV